jgi:large subunit ribosomal protein L13
MKTFSQKAEDAKAQRSWKLVNVQGVPVGRVASEIAKVLKGKNKPTYTPHVDCGDFVVVVNARDIVFTGSKRAQKRYYTHSGYTGGIREETVTDLLERKPEEIIRRAVRGMLPRGPLGYQMLKKLKVYSGSEHPHSAQQPELLEFSL